ncbi:periplasmic binding protein-like I [Obelidium mucronatum]|nr:periplasmic binding protein-like I [Obelidium mucronatum]
MKPVDITIGLIGQYCYLQGLEYENDGSLVTNFALDYYTSSQVRANLSLDYASDMGVYLGDLSRLAAVELINNSPEILPGVHVNVKRFSECGPYDPSYAENGYPRMTGYASSILGPDIVFNNPDVVGVMGFLYSSTAKGVMNELSLHKIPTCGVGPTSPRFADRSNYPYVMLISPTMGFGEHLYQLLKFWNVGNIALIYQTGDDMSMSFAKDIRKSMNKHHVTIVEDVGIPDTSKDSIKTTCATLIMSNARYFVYSGQYDFMSDLHVGLGGCGLVGPRYVSISYQGIYPVSTSTQHLDLGFIALQNPNPSSDMSFFELQHPIISNVSIHGFTIKEIINDFQYFQSFDCALMLLMGLDKLLKSNPSFTPEMLASRKLQDHMNYTLFQKIGYDGLNAQPMILNEYGSLELPYEAQYTLPDDAGSTVGFGRTDLEATIFTPYPHIKPVFSGNTSTVPLDVLNVIYREFVPSIRNASGIIILAIIVVAGTFCITSSWIVSRFKGKKTMVRTSVSFIISVIGGSFLLWISLFLELLAGNVVKCHFTVWLRVLGYCSIVAALNSKLMLMYYLIVSGKKVERSFSAAKFTTIPFATMLALDIILLILWSALSSQTVVKPKILFDNYVTSCHSGKKTVMDIFLWVYNIGILVMAIILVIATRDSESYTGESTFAAVIVATLSVIAIIILPVTLLAANPSTTTILISSGTIFALISITLGSILVPKMISIWSDREKVENQLQSFFKSNNAQESSFIRNLSSFATGARTSKVGYLSATHRDKIRKASKVDTSKRNQVGFHNLGLAIARIQRRKVLQLETEWAIAQFTMIAFRQRISPTRNGSVEKSYLTLQNLSGLNSNLHRVFMSFALVSTAASARPSS